MSKIDTNTVCQIVQKNVSEPATVRAIIEEINLAVQPDGADEEKTPHEKKQFVVIASDPNGALANVPDFVAWVVQIPESESVSTTTDRVFRAAYDFNASRKGRLCPVKTVGEAMEVIPVRFTKETMLWIKTKEPVLVIRTDNVIPKPPAE